MYYFKIVDDKEEELVSLETPDFMQGMMDALHYANIYAEDSAVTVLFKQARVKGDYKGVMWLNKGDKANILRYSGNE